MFKSIFLQYRWSLVGATLLSILGALSGLVMLKIITDQLSLIGAGESLTWQSFAIFLGMICVMLLFGLFSRYLLAKLSAQVVYKFRDSLAKRLLATPYATVEQIGGHRILAAMKTDAAKLSDGLLVLPGVIYSFVTVLFCLGYMIYISWQLFLIVLALIAVVVVIAQLSVSYALKHLIKLRSCEDTLFKGLSTLVNGVKELSINQKRRRFIYQEILEPTFGEIRDRSVKVSLIFTMLNSMTSTLVFLVIGSIVFGSGIFLTGLPVGIIISFVFIIFYMINPLDSVIGSFNQFGDFMASYRNIEGLQLVDIREFENKVASSKQRDQELPWQTLAVQQVSFQYRAADDDDEYHFSLAPVDLTFQRGEVVFLTGGNGSGKSTFAKLLVGLYQPDSGAIHLGAAELGKDLSQEYYQHQFSTIFSDFHLFEHVLAPSGELANDEDIASHLKELELERSVTTTQGQLSTLSLSQGQRKRVALMMSFIENTPICLYDEWAADQDPRYREIFYTQIIPQLKQQNKLVIIISHDDRYFHLADQLVQFEQGTVVSCTRPNVQKEGAAV